MMMKITAQVVVALSIDVDGAWTNGEQRMSAFAAAARDRALAYIRDARLPGCTIGNPVVKLIIAEEGVAGEAER